MVNIGYRDLLICPDCSFKEIKCLGIDAEDGVLNQATINIVKKSRMFYLLANLDKIVAHSSCMDSVTTYDAKSGA